MENEFIVGAIVMISFLFMYTFIKVIHFTALKIYFCFVEGTILWKSIIYFKENEVLDLGVLIILLFVQGMLIYFIKVDYKKDLCRKEIYLKISSHFIPLIVMGISEVKKTDIDKFLNTLDNLLRNSDKMERKAFCFFQYEEGCINFHALFLRKSDMYIFIEDKEFLELKTEEVGKGGSIELKMQS